MTTDDARTPPPKNDEWSALLPQVREHFRLEIGNLLADVPISLWEEPHICGLLYDFLPWHRHSSLSIQLQEDDPDDIGGWTHYECVNPDGRAVTEEFDMWDRAYHYLVYHRLLIEAAESLLAFDFTRFGQREAIEEDGYLNPLFKLQVYHADNKFSFNYCEYVLARRFEQS